MDLRNDHGRNLLKKKDFLEMQYKLFFFKINIVFSINLTGYEQKINFPL